ncbi:MAG: GIY-YIG nuclease family protein [Salibacteraceae bacterium]|jgi:putative endonuclease|nr:GIY-YIG nuclease family protein [Salibacteraceae bacterium]
MFTVYCLYSRSFDKICVGYTSDLTQRFRSHNELSKKGFTLKFRPWIVAHTEVFETKSEAMAREKQLKTAAGRAFLRQFINDNYRS